MFLKHTKLTAAALAFILLAPAYVDAKGGRGGGSFSSARSSSSYSKPTTSLPGASRPATVNTGGSQNRNITTNNNTYSKPATTTNGTQGYSRPSVPAPSTTMKPDAVGALGNAASATMSRDSLQKYMQERNAFGKAPAVFDKGAVRSDPVVRQTKAQYPKIDDYMQSRSREREAYTARHPETARYTQTMQPNYGMFDSNFLMGMLLGHWTGSSGSNNNNNAANAEWLKSQSNQEWYTHWRADLERASKENAELKSRIQDLDKQMAEIKTTTPPVKALPDGVPSSLALAPEAMIVDAYENHSFPWGWTLFMLLLGGVALVAFYFHQQGSRRTTRRYA